MRQSGQTNQAIAETGVRRNRATELLLRSAAGDQAAFAHLYSLTSAKMRKVAVAQLQDRLDVDDVLQDAYLKIWFKARQFDPHLASPISWMCAIVRNTAIDALRLSRLAVVDLDHALEVPDTADDPLEVLAAERDRTVLVEAMTRLPPDRRTLVSLAYFQGESREALAARFGAPQATIKTWLRRALITLKDTVERERALAV